MADYSIIYKAFDRSLNGEYNDPLQLPSKHSPKSISFPTKNNFLISSSSFIPHFLN